jgi:hypothetical protein
VTNPIANSGFINRYTSISSMAMSL